MTTVFVLMLALFIVSAQGQISSLGPTGFFDQTVTATPSFHGTDKSLAIKSSEADIPLLQTNVSMLVSTNYSAVSLPVSTIAQESSAIVQLSSIPAELSTFLQSSATEMTSSMHLSSYYVPPSHGLFSTNSLTIIPLSSSHDIPHPSPTQIISNTSYSVPHNVSSIVPSVTSAVLPSSSTIAPTPTPVVKYECGPQCKTLKHRMMAAVGFAVVLGIICVVLAFLLWRQYRAQNSDGSSGFSRLI